MSRLKWNISIYCGFIFFLFSSNSFYKNLSKVLNLEYNNCPSYELMLISSVLFALLLRYMMKHKGASIDKWRYTYYTWYMFIFLNNPLTYNLLNNLFSKYLNLNTADGNCPKVIGLYVHTILFTIFLRYSMDLEPKRKID